MGYSWNFCSDSLGIFPYNFQIKGATKRSVLRDVCSVYDPLGFINPVIIMAKVLLQKIWGLGFAWDDKLNTELVDEWQKISSQIEAAIPKNFNRWLGIKEFDKVSLHIFTDAGNRRQFS